MPEKARAHLFQAFQGSARKGGTGLGLAVAHELVTAHGGIIRLRDTSNGAAFESKSPTGAVEGRGELPCRDIYDLAIIGGGINGCGIARDAAGRGLSVFLCEMGDLAERHLLALDQADPRRPALPRAVRLPPGARGAGRARGAVAHRAAYRAAAALRAAAPGWAASRVDAARGPVPLRPSGRQGSPARHPRSRSCIRCRRRAPEARRVHHRLRVFRLLGRRCPPRRPQRARCGRPRRRHPHPYAGRGGRARRRRLAPDGRELLQEQPGTPLPRASSSMPPGRGWRRCRAWSCTSACRAGSGSCRGRISSCPSCSPTTAPISSRTRTAASSSPFPTRAILR